MPTLRKMDLDRGTASSKACAEARGYATLTPCPPLRDVLTPCPPLRDAERGHEGKRAATAMAGDHAAPYARSSASRHCCSGASLTASRSPTLTSSSFSS